MVILELNEDDADRLDLALTLAVNDLDGWYGCDAFRRTLDKVRKQHAEQDVDRRIESQASDVTPPLMIALQLLSALETSTTDGARPLANCPP